MKLKFLGRLEHKMRNLKLFGATGLKRIEETVRKMELKRYRTERRERFAY